MALIKTHRTKNLQKVFKQVLMDQGNLTKLLFKLLPSITEALCTSLYFLANACAVLQARVSRPYRQVPKWALSMETTQLRPFYPCRIHILIHSRLSVITLLNRWVILGNFVSGVEKNINKIILKHFSLFKFWNQHPPKSSLVSLTIDYIVTQL